MTIDLLEPVASLKERLGRLSSKQPFSSPSVTESWRYLTSAPVILAAMLRSCDP